MPQVLDDGIQAVEDERDEARRTQQALSQAVADSRTVHWIFFILGCAILLPWNGKRFDCPSETGLKSLTQQLSPQCHSFFLVSNGLILNPYFQAI